MCRSYPGSGRAVADTNAIHGDFAAHDFVAASRLGEDRK